MIENKSEDLNKISHKSRFAKTCASGASGVENWFFLHFFLFILTLSANIPATLTADRHTG